MTKTKSQDISLASKITTFFPHYWTMDNGHIGVCRSRPLCAKNPATFSRFKKSKLFIPYCVGSTPLLVWGGEGKPQLSRVLRNTDRSIEIASETVLRFKQQINYKRKNRQNQEKC